MTAPSIQTEYVAAGDGLLVVIYRGGAFEW